MESVESLFSGHVTDIFNSDLSNPEVRNRYELLKRSDPNAPRFAIGVSFSGNEANPLFHNTGGAFEEIGTTLGISRREDGRGLAVLDLNQDGAMDVVVRNHYRNPMVAMINLAAKDRRWIRIRLRGTSSNRFGIGARVWAGGGMQEMTCGSGFLSGNAPVLHFGMAGAKTAAVKVRWPSGAVQTYPALETNRIHEFVEGDQAAHKASSLRSIGIAPELGAMPPRSRLDVYSILANLRTLENRPAPVRVEEKPVVALFFSVNCHVCRGELKRAPELKRRAEEKGARFVWVNVDANLERAQKGMEMFGEGVKAYRPARNPGPVGVPTVYLVRSGQVEKFMGRHAVTAALERVGQSR